MSKRGRRRNSRRRKSSSSSKQSVSPYIFQKQNNSNSDNYKDDIVEKGEIDSFRKENILSGSEDEEKYNDPPKEKKCKQDYNVNSFPNQRNIYTKTTEDKEKGVKIVTSVSVNDVEDSSLNVMFQQSHEPLSQNQSHSLTPLTNIMKINCSGLHLKLEIQETLQLNTCDAKTTFAFMNEGCCDEKYFNRKYDGGWIPNNESSEQLSQDGSGPTENPNTKYTFTFGSMSGQTETHGESKSVSPKKMWDSPNYSQFCNDHKIQASTDIMLKNPPLLNIKPQGKRKHFQKIVSTDHFWDVPPPQEFADITFNSLEDLTHELASCRISPADKQQMELHLSPNITSNEESGCTFSVEAEERADLSSPFFDRLSECDNYEHTLLRPSLSTDRNSLTEDFINHQKRKSWFRNNSIATLEHRTCLMRGKRRNTFPGMSDGLGLMQEDLLLPYSECFSSLIMNSLPLHTVGQVNIHQVDDQLSTFGIGNYSQSKGSSEPISEIQNCQDGKQSLLSPFYLTSSGDKPDYVFSDSKQWTGTNNLKELKQQDMDTDDCVYKVDPSDVADIGFDQEMGEVEYHSPDPFTVQGLNQRSLDIQVILPSCSGSEEQTLQGHPVTLVQDKVIENENQEELVSVLSKHSVSSVKAITGGALEPRFLQLGSRSSLTSCMENHIPTASEDPCRLPSLELNVSSLNTIEVPEEIEETNDLQLDSGSRVPEESDRPKVNASSPAKGSAPKDIPSEEQLSNADNTDKQNVSRSCCDAKEHLKPVVHKEPDSSSSSDHWAKRRKLFKESKQWSSTGASSITSDITEESVSDETRSIDMTFRENEDRGFYTETFHSSTWIYQGDDVSSDAIPPSLNARTRAVSTRERTVKVSKGTGDYPWGFRIQFSKPIVVTEVDTNGAAEEAGLMVGDYVLAVNGIDVTSIPHSEAADLARQGPDLLTLTIGSDIARCPNTPRPACRGYLHKRTQSGLIKGWRKRWFVLTHDRCLLYYRHKRDEGKQRALSAVKLEGAEVGPDVSLGKPFVFKCRPQSGNRVFFFCATSNQEMKRWLESMEKAIYPITQNHVWEDVTRHNSNLPPLAVKNPECLGLLHKMDKSKDMWVQHYCILKDGCLSLYSGIRATHAHGGIYLQGYMVREQPYGSKKSTIELKPPSDEFKTFYFCAENPNENKRWILAIKASIKKWLPLHQALQDYMSRPPEETRM